MSRWKELPADLDANVCQLVVRLRRLKDHAGLSLRQVAAKTGYSAKSWERYLGGRSLPPREAVEALARIGGEDPARLLALHEVAAEAWKGGRERTPKPTVPEPQQRSEPAPTPAPKPRLPGRARHLVLLAAAVLVPSVAIAVHAVVRHTGGGSEKASAARSAPTYTCRVERIDGRWYAGNSRTDDALLAYGLAGPDVAEAQCLLHRAGFAPGDIDGIYGPLTERAVKRAQQHAGLVVDGIVGQHTWKILRE